MLNIRLDKKSTTPLYVQLRDSIQQAIHEGTLNSGDRLPTVASLAKQLKVAHSTVRRALEDLAQSGLVNCHVGRGTFVTDPAVSLGRSGGIEVASVPPASAAVEAELALAARRLRMGIAKSLDALLALAAKPGLLRFTSGVPAASTLQADTLERLTRQALKNGQAAYAGYSPPGGLPELRQAVAARLTAAGTEVPPEEVLITSGSQQAVSLLAQSALETNAKILCEVPCYMGVPKAFGAVGHWVESVRRDTEGPKLDELSNFTDERPLMLYLCPELHNPMGTDLHPLRRKALIDWANRSQALLICDEIFHDLRFDGSTPRSLLAEAGGNRAAVIGSLSKSFMCGLRIGWLASSRERVQSLIELKNAVDIGSPPLMQGIALELLRSGEYDDHVRRVRRLYQIRCEATLKALKHYMPKDLTWTRPAGGFHMWVELPSGYSSVVLFLLAVERGVAFVPGPKHDIDHRFINAFRLSYGNLRPEQIDKGIRQLAEAVKELLKHPPSDTGLSGVGSFL